MRALLDNKRWRSSIYWELLFIAVPLSFQRNLAVIKKCCSWKLSCLHHFYIQELLHYSQNFFLVALLIFPTKTFRLLKLLRNLFSSNCISIPNRLTKLQTCLQRVFINHVDIKGLYKMFMKGLSANVQIVLGKFFMNDLYFGLKLTKMHFKSHQNGHKWAINEK